jgi:hypothetical protein
MKQWLFSGIAAVLLVASGYVTAAMTTTYVAAVLNTLQGAGAAQWQLQFLLAPFPALLGLAALLVAGFVDRPLNSSLQAVSVLATAAPILLLVLVLSHAY